LAANRHALSHRARRPRTRYQKRVSWHTFRRTYTSLLHANGEDVKVVQELLRHGSAKVTLDVYAQAQMPAKRRAQHKVVEMVRPEARKEALEMAT
jgi:integrase